MENPKVAQVFEEVADLLEIQGENPFRVRAYRNAARTIRDLSGIDGKSFQPTDQNRRAGTPILAGLFKGSIYR